MNHCDLIVVKWSCAVLCRITRFIVEAVDPYCSELMKLLFPLFAHIFLELLIAGHKMQGNSCILNQLY